MDELDPAWVTPYALEGLVLWRDRMGSALLSTFCHYCGRGGKMTQDHVVPKSQLPPGILQPYWFRGNNIVASCSPCNNAKGCLRSDCECRQCRWAWSTAKALWGVEEKGLIYLVGGPPC